MVNKKSNSEKNTMKFKDIKLVFEPKFSKVKDGITFKCKTLTTSELIKILDTRYKRK